MILLALAACSGDDPGPPTDTTQVLILGSGAAGLSAAHEALAKGKTVTVLERADGAGGSSWYAGRFWATGTRWQEAAGVVDTPAAALSDWSGLTFGGDPDDPRVVRFVEDSGPTVEWLVDTFGLEAPPIERDDGYPGPARMHVVNGGEAMLAMVDALGDDLVLNTEAVGLVFDRDGRVIGARWRPTDGGPEGWTQADATVLATGGFGRDLDRVFADRPEVAGMNVLTEIAPTSVGAGIAVLDGVGTWQNEGSSGLYFHSVPDPRPENPGEPLWPGGLASTLMVDGGGRRIANENEYNTFKLVERVAATEERRLFAFYPSLDWPKVLAAVPAYTSTPTDPWTADQLEAAGLATRYEDVDAIAAALGIDAPTLRATVDAYDQAGITGNDVAFGKDRSQLHPFGKSPIVVMELFAGSAKSFVGYAVDVEGRVLAPDGSVVPGVYAAGEATGMLGTPAIGEGLSGAITSCYSTGRLAGKNAADGR